MTDSQHARDLLRSALHELNDLRRRMEIVEREKRDRPAIIGAACCLPGPSESRQPGSSQETLACAQRPDSPFDFEFFGIDAAEAAQMPPHLGLLLETGWEALERAGWPPAALRAERVGVFIGIGGSQAQNDGQPPVLPAIHSAQRLARAFGFRGPTVNIDAGEASAVEAIDTACRSLMTGGVDVALTGAVVLAGGLNGAAPTASGCGLLVMKRLSDMDSQRDSALAIVELDQASEPRAVEDGGGGTSHFHSLMGLFRALAAVQKGASPEAATAVTAWGGGAHASIVLTPAPATEDEDCAGPELLLLSARDEAALEAVAHRLVTHLIELQDDGLANIAYTLRAGRTHFAHRRYVVAQGRQSAAAALATGGPQALSGQAAPQPAFLFPGLGSHYLDMARDLYWQEAVYRQAVDRCAQSLQDHLDVDIRKVMFRANGPSPAQSVGSAQVNLRQMLRRQVTETDPAAAQLDQTIYAQPVLFTVEYALADLLASWGIRPGAMLGYSLGEYVAACLAGVMSVEDALFIVATRARLIQDLPAGKMVAVPMAETEVAPLLGPGLAISAVNGESVCVVGGKPEAIDELAAKLSVEGIAAQMLPTTHAFHTELLRPMAERFKAALETIKLRPPTVPYVSNLTGDWIGAAEATSPAYWVEHACRPVRFSAGIQALWRGGYGLLLEVGPSQALSSLAIAIGREVGAEAPPPIPTMRPQYDPQPDSVVIQKALGELWLAGASVDWESFRPARRIALPTYPFRRAGPSQNQAAPAMAAKGGESAGRPAGAGTNTEAALASLWSELLKLPSVDPQRTFFEQGGNSLLAAQLAFRIKKTFGVDLPLRALYRAAGLPAMARLMDGHADVPDNLDGGASSRLAESAGVPLMLPNGLTILCFNQQEVGHFYEDIFVDRVYVSHGINLSAGDVVFDVGANVGLFSLFAHQQAPGIRIHAFEPAPPLFKLLKSNLERHGVAATVYNDALSSTLGSADLTFYPKSTGMSSLYADLEEEKAILATVLENQVRRGERELEPLLAHAGDYLAERFQAEHFTCRLRTLSEVLAESGVERIDLLKIDVQKAELDVMLGISDEDWPRIRQVVVEVHDVDGRLARLRAMLQDRGFHVESGQEALYAGSPIYLLYGRRPGQQMVQG
jgi:phthiocerol/phenolphthiocerol synthesis type-I polyketide synthase E